MDKIIISICFLFVTLSVKTQSVSGIRVDGGDTPILVYVGGSQMCLPTTTCFIANLKAGNYTIEVYASRYTRSGERPSRGQKLYSERIYFSGSGVKDIYAYTQNNSRPENRPVYNGVHSNNYQDDNVMDARLFNSFYISVERESSASDRIRTIETALTTSDFTCDQCLRLTQLFSFDNDKMIVMRKMYPQIVDKQAFFSLISTLKYSSSKETMNTFVKNYNSSIR